MRLRERLRFFANAPNRQSERRRLAALGRIIDQLRCAKCLGQGSAFRKVEAIMIM